jgi:hypothetical protein
MVAESASTPLPAQVTPDELIGAIARLVRELPCHHCGKASGVDQPALLAPRTARAQVPAAREPYDDHACVGDLDEISDDERWLWRLIDEADRVAAAAPVGPDPGHLAQVEQRHAAACSIEQRVQARIRATTAALARPTSWLRPGHRAALARHLREDQMAAVLAAMQRGRVEEVRSRLRGLSQSRADYLAAHHATLAAGRNARVALTRLLDDLIDSYARLPEPPAWFRFGLDFPPEPGTRQLWLERAREALTQRRRLALDQPFI